MTSGAVPETNHLLAGGSNPVMDSETSAYGGDTTLKVGKNVSLVLGNKGLVIRGKSVLKLPLLAPGKNLLRCLREKKTSI